MPRPLSTSPLTRRSLLTGILAVSGTAALAACGAEEESPAGGGSSSSAPAGPWTFTDDVGRTVELDAVPTRIAGLTDQVAAMWNLGIVPVAAFGYTPMKDDVAFEGKPIEDVVETGSGYGEIDLEALAAAAPELIVTTVYPVDASGDIPEGTLLYGFKDEQQLEKIEKIAPVIAIAQRGSAVDVIERNVELVKSLGIDTDGGEVAAAREDFEAAGKELTEAARSGLTVMAIAAYPAEGMYVAKAPDDPALRYYTELGLEYAEIGGDGYYWETVSWENADTYQTDLIINSLRAMTIDELQGQPTFARLPAAQADQVFDWKFQSMDYASQASYMRELAELLTDSEKVT